jgi:hypothetical protein
MKPRRDLEEAFFPRLDIPEKPCPVLPEGLPSLREIKPGSAVLIDASIVMLAMDSRRLGYVTPRSTQCENLIFDAKNRNIRGFITPFIIDDVWKALHSALQRKDYARDTGGDLPYWAHSINDLCRRLQALCGAAIETLPAIASDLEKALQLAKETPLGSKVALSLAAMHRAVGPEFAFATADPDSAGSGLAGVFVPTDLDQFVPMGEEGQWIRGRTWVLDKVKKPVRTWPPVEAGSD